MLYMYASVRIRLWKLYVLFRIEPRGVQFCMQIQHLAMRMVKLLVYGNDGNHDL